MSRFAALATGFAIAAVPAPRFALFVSAPTVVPPIADPALEPGVARCTSDGACTVTDQVGTRSATPIAPSR